jgi:uncharacterized membrane protein YfhO
VLGLAGLRRIMESGLWRSGMAAGAGFVLAIPAAAILLLPAQVNVEQVIRIAAFASAYTAILFMTRGTSRRTGLHHVLLPIVACELLMFAMPPAVERDAVRLDGSGSIGNFHDGSDQALAFVRQYNRQLPSDADFYRIDKSYYSSFLNDALVQDYPGTSSYFHQTSSITRFVDRMNLDRITQGPNYISSMSNRRDVMDLLGVRYLLSLDRKPDAERDLTLLATVGNVNIYRNATAHAFGTFYPAIASESEADVLPVPQRDAFLLSHIVVEDPQATRAELASLNTGSAGGHPGQQAHIKESRDDQLSGTVETPSASALLLSMPFDRGWSAVLDDAPLPLFRADYGLTGALIPAGSHRLMLSYTPPGRMLGWWLATGSLGFLLGLHMVRRNAMVARPPRRMLSNSP